jgi:hypothetical protein
VGCLILSVAYLTVVYKVISGDFKTPPYIITKTLETPRVIGFGAQHLVWTRRDWIDQVLHLRSSVIRNTKQATNNMAA